MSDLMFDEIPAIEGKSRYDYGDWKSYAIHDEKNIKGFFGSFRFLSNFEPCDVWFEGLKYPSSENAFQSSKVNVDYRHNFVNITPAQSKKEWKNYPKIDASKEEWDKRRYDVMSVILFEKFYRNKDLRQKLIDTGDRCLEERNHWKDLWWGTDTKGVGENNLGKILMKIRKYWM